jgi:hypothetical protein
MGLLTWWAPGEDPSEVTDDVPFARVGAVSPNIYSHRSFRPKQADAFSPSFVRERVGLRSGEISLRSLAPADTPHSGAIGVLWPVYSQRSFQQILPNGHLDRSKPTPFPPGSSANESACAVEKSLFDPSRQPTPLTQAQSEYSGLSRQV